jgi:hypothetical protein
MQDLVRKAAGRQDLVRTEVESRSDLDRVSRDSLRPDKVLHDDDSQSAV